MGQRDGAGTQNGQIGQYPRELQGVQGFNPMLGGMGPPEIAPGWLDFRRGLKIFGHSREIMVREGDTFRPPTPTPSSSTC